MPKYLSTKPNKASGFTSLHSYHSTHGHDTSTYDAHDILDQISASLQPTVSESAFDKPFETPSPVTATPVHSLHSAIHSAISVAASSDDVMNPRELEWFAERFKQRRIKLGVTQADVGAALAHLKIPGVGSLSQSTICRFESLTLSHNNMMALKPVLTAWLEEAEKAYKCKNTTSQFLPNSDKKRKRTSIGAAEKRSLEAYFAMNPRPSSDKIASIAEKLDLSKNVVRVWFCNQRQKKKRMKFSVHWKLEKTGVKLNWISCRKSRRKSLHGSIDVSADADTEWSTAIWSKLQMVNFIYIINENFWVNEWSKSWFLLLLLLSYRSFKNKIIVRVCLRSELARPWVEKELRWKAMPLRSALEDVSLSWRNMSRTT